MENKKTFGEIIELWFGPIVFVTLLSIPISLCLPEKDVPYENKTIICHMINGDIIEREFYVPNYAKPYIHHYEGSYFLKYERFNIIGLQFTINLMPGVLYFEEK